MEELKIGSKLIATFSKTEFEVLELNVLNNKYIFRVKITKVTDATSPFNKVGQKVCLGYSGIKGGTYKIIG